jgi:protein TonB
MTSFISFGDDRDSRMAVWLQHNRWLIVSFLLSLATHIAAVAMIPQLRRGADRLIPRTLDVIIVRPAVPLPAIEKPVVQPQPKREPPREYRQVTRASRPAIEPPMEPPPKPVLALPDPGPQSPAAFTVPQIAVEPAPPVEQKFAAATPAAPAPVRDTAPTVLASLNAAYLRNTPPKYPLIARRNGVEGTVRLKVFVTRDGHAGQVQLDHTSGSSALDNAALDAVRTWQFVPARRGQDSIDSWVVVPVVFKLEGTS